jgi:peptidoglycan hydrolase-like protein with peptidoglycan-binding domain
MPVLDASGFIIFGGDAHELTVLSPGEGAGYEDEGIQFGGSATLTLGAPVAPPPDPHHLIATKWLTITAGPTLDANGQPDAAAWRAAATEHSGTWGRYRIVVAGVDVSYFRGAQTLVLNESDAEPFGDDMFTVQFPMISPFEQLGVGDLAWLPGTDDNKHIPVTVEKVNVAGTHSTRWEGDCNVLTDNYDGSSGPLVVQFIGLAQTLDERITKPRNTSDPIDVGRLIHYLAAYEAKYGWNGHPPATVLTGTQTAERGGYGDALASVTIQNLLAEDGEHTLTNLRPRGLRLIVKDRTTVHFRLWCGQAGVTHQLQRNLEHAVTAIFGEGTDAGTQFWRNTQYPNAPISPPSYPLSTGVFFTPGGGHTGFKPFSDELRTRGYHLSSRDTYLSVDQAVIRDFQDDAGISVDGVVGGQTWNAAFAFNLSAHALDAYIRPLAVVSAAEPFLYNTRGGIIGRNPGYTGRTRRERKEDFGTLPKAAAKKSAKAELVVIRSADYFGTVTAENIDPPEMCALDTRAGMNLLFKGHRGVDRLLHVAKADKNPGMAVGQNRTVTWTASSAVTTT